MSDIIRIIVPYRVFCPHCGARHVDETRNGERWDRRAHTTHRCQACFQDWEITVSGASDETLEAEGNEKKGKEDGIR